MIDPPYGASILKTDTDAIPYVITQPEGAAIIFTKFTNAELYGVGDFRGDSGWRSDLPYFMLVAYKGDNAGLVGDYVIGFPATENFKAATFTITVTA